MPSTPFSTPAGNMPYDWNAAFPQLSQSFGGGWMPGVQGNLAASPYAAPQSMDNFSMNQTGGNPFAGAGWAPNGQAAPAESPGVMGWLSNYQNLGTAVQGFGTLAQAWLSYQGLKNAREALGLQKEAFNANLNNSIQTYNTSLEDRIRGRTADYTGKESDVQSYLAKNSLHR